MAHHRKVCPCSPSKQPSERGHQESSLLSVSPTVAADCCLDSPLLPHVGTLVCSADEAATDGSGTIRQTRLPHPDARRPDVLTYQTAPLDKPLTLVGPITAALWVSTSEGDADWIAKVIDVFPDDATDHQYLAPGKKMAGYPMMVRSEVIRGRFRNDPSRPQPFRPNTPTRVTLPLQDICHTFLPGHRLMVQIQSTWFPLVDRNPQKYVENIYQAKPEDFVKAVHRVYRSGKHATRSEFLMMGD